MRAQILVPVLVVALLTPAVAAVAQPSIDVGPRPAALAADVSSLDAILAALYDVISGPKGEARDWTRFRSLLAPNARLMPTRPRPGGGTELVVWSADDYVRAAGPGLSANGFYEREVHRVTERFGDVVHVFSTYESRRTADPAEAPFARGINSIQLLKDGARWWVVSIYWQAERPGTPIPAAYLPK
ncbi:MAG: hypothetical protein R2745_22290 [Vicinamibacterales bacterium]